MNAREIDHVLAKSSVAPAHAVWESSLLCHATLTALLNPKGVCVCSVHYNRIHPTYWKDRLQRVQALGLNTVEVCSMPQAQAT